MPQSTVRMPAPEAIMGPIVDPHPISFLTTNSYTETREYVKSNKVILVILGKECKIEN